MVERRLNCENCRHLTIIGLHDTGPCLLLNNALRECGRCGGGGVVVVVVVDVVVVMVVEVTVAVVVLLLVK